MRRLLPVAAALMMMMMMASAAFGVARAQGTWSTAQLSVGRWYLAAASAGNVALFAGGVDTSVYFYHVWGCATYDLSESVYWLLHLYLLCLVLRLGMPLDRLLSKL